MFPRQGLWYIDQLKGLELMSSNWRITDYTGNFVMFVKTESEAKKIVKEHNKPIVEAALRLIRDAL